MRLRFTHWAWSLALGHAIAGAHGLVLDVTVEGSFLQGTARYSDKSPVASESVRIFNPPESATPVATLVTGADGRFGFEAKITGNYRVVLDAGEGHLAERVVSVAARSAAATAGGVTRAELDSALAPLREDLAQLRREWRLSDLLSAIGYVLGAFGLVAWLRARKH